jgi:hypothetical protein
MFETLETKEESWDKIIPLILYCIGFQPYYRRHEFGSVVLGSDNLGVSISLPLLLP